MRSLQAEQLLESEGATFRRESRPITDFDLAAGLLNQARERPLIDELVEAYTLMLEDGLEAPAVIAYTNNQGRLVAMDGNQRLHAAKAHKDTTIDCYIVDVETRQKREALLLTINQKLNGLRLSGPANLANAMAWHKEFTNVPITEVARLFGYRAGYLQDKVRIEDTINRLDAVGIDIRELSTAAVSQLWGIKSEPAVEAIALLLNESGARGTLADEIIATVKATRSDASALAMADRLRQRSDIKDLILRKSHGRSRIPTLKRDNLFRHINGAIRILNKADGVSSLELRSSDDFEKLIDRCQLLNNLMRKLLFTSNGRETTKLTI